MTASSIPSEKRAPHSSGFFMLIIILIGLCSSTACFVFGILRLTRASFAIGGVLLAVGTIGLIAFPILCAGFKVLAPNQAYVFTLFGRYFGTLNEPGFYHLNPFVVANAPAVMNGEPTEQTTRTAHGVSVTLRKLWGIPLHPVRFHHPQYRSPVPV